MIKKIIMNSINYQRLLFGLSILLVGFTNEIKAQKKAFEKRNLIQYVDPMIGTAKMGHTYPGATVPFGSVQLSPETDTIAYSLNGKYNGEVYKYCAG
jgi:putative alpha-1,2-mannosidase